MSVKIIFIAHNSTIVTNILNDPKRASSSIIFVGDQSLPEYLMADSRVIIARNYADNIESNKELLTFTAWYVISKNNLFMEYDYLCLLEYDVTLDTNFEDNLTKLCKNTQDKIISFIVDNVHFLFDIQVNVLKYFLSTKNISFNNPIVWYSSTNHCIRRDILLDFVDWYYPSCNIIKKLDFIRVSWYHERLFTYYIKNKNYSVSILNGLSHDSSNSHTILHNTVNSTQEELVNKYIENPHCEFLNKLIDNYNIFIELNSNEFNYGRGSPLINHSSYTYDPDVYEKQKLIYDTSKKSTNCLVVGNYMGHVLFIILLANPNIKITYTDEKHKICMHSINVLLNRFNSHIDIIDKDTIEQNIHHLYNHRNSYDFCHIDQQYPIRGYIYNYMNGLLYTTCRHVINFIIDDIYVYDNNLQEILYKDNVNIDIINYKENVCKNKNCLIEIKLYKKYILLYDDNSGRFDNDIANLVNSIKTYSNFEIIIFNKNKIDKNFKNDNEHILNESRGDGYWLWKPYIIKETLNKLEYKDILFYIDARYSFTEPFSPLIEYLVKNDFLLWKNKPNEDSYILKNWCKMDVVVKYDMHIPVFEENCTACWAGCMVMRKSEFTVNFINEWLQMCCNYNNITDSNSVIPNSGHFVEHRHDQSLLTILSYKNGVNLQYFERKYLQNSRIPY